ncbi:unnamed protein product [Lactuca saligna]|uniref:Polynucleotide adenylyltransferase n=1 Tax=Lactuca saligna TaxID=75948 RepID=A0AA35Y9H1_LACSI|nr:unnamed protein product [Lactuca saligna]
MDETGYGEGSAWDSKTGGKSKVLCYLSSLVNKTYYIVLTAHSNHRHQKESQVFDFTYDAFWQNTAACYRQKNAILSTPVSISSRDLNHRHCHVFYILMAAITVRRNVFLLPIKPLFSLQGLFHKFVELDDSKPRLLSEDDYLIFKPGEINVSKWKKLDSRSLGITRTIPPSPFAVLQILRTRGFEAYLVGGCVRDLLLNRTPKDFDVITTAHLEQISKQFHNCEVVGKRFPVCRVYIKGSIVEVSSFDTLAKETEGKEKFLISQMPRGCDKLDLLRWKNSMHRDFTINSLFFDPFIHTIYDYNDGMKDLLELKLRTLVPAQLSFTEDSARILRGVRIAARLGLSLSKEIKSAIFKQTSSITRLGQSRTMMEINYMLSFGAAESSFSLLHKYHLLEILLPFQAAYISQQATRFDQSSMMLMKLLSHLDKLVSCDRPSGSPLWIGILAFHLALVNNPQHPFVILTFASVLYHQSWKDGLKFARKYGQPPVNFDPESLDTYDEFISDDEIATKVNQLAIMVIDSVDVLMETYCLNHAMENFPGSPSPSPCSGFVFISKNMGYSAQQLFHVLAHKLEAYNEGRTSFEINFDLLKKGYSLETRFALGKIILNTLGCGIGQTKVNPCSLENERFVNKKHDIKQPPLSFNINLQQESVTKSPKMITKLSSIMQDKSKGVFSKHKEVVGISSDPKNKDLTTNKQEIGSPMEELICMVESSIDNDKLESQNHEERNRKVKVNQSNQNGTTMLVERRVENDETGISSLLRSVQTNFNMAIKEARDSIPEMRKLNRFLESFVDEQAERKKEKIESFQEKSIQLESASSLVSEVNNSKELESCSSFEVSSNVTLSTPEIHVQHLDLDEKVNKSSQHKKVMKVKGERKKQKVCSYCKEVGHNKTGCPKRKVDTDST